MKSSSASLARAPGSFHFDRSIGHGVEHSWTVSGAGVRADAVLPDVRLHDLRHTYATFALRRGESVLAIGRLLGHSDPGTTLKYTHLADATIRKAIETVGVALEG